MRVWAQKLLLLKDMAENQSYANDQENSMYISVRPSFMHLYNRTLLLIHCPKL